MGWKIFFWIYLVLGALSLTAFPSTPKLIDLAGIPMTILEIAALYSFAYKKKLFAPSTWKIFFKTYLGFFVVFLVGVYSLYTNTFPLLVPSVLESVPNSQKFPSVGVTFVLFFVFMNILNTLAYSKRSR